MEDLAARGIDTRPFFYPIHRLPPYLPKDGAPVDLPVTESLAASGVNLPTSPQMTEDDVAWVADAIRQARA
jgi:perosamine synthetase